MITQLSWILIRGFCLYKLNSSSQDKSALPAQSALYLVLFAHHQHKPTKRKKENFKIVKPMILITLGTTKPLITIRSKQKHN